MLTPLDYVGLNWAWNFSSEQCQEGMVGIQGQNLRYVSTFSSNQQSLVLMNSISMLFPRVVLNKCGNKH
jgi:splicing factor 3B subunit 3